VISTERIAALENKKGLAEVIAHTKTGCVRGIASESNKARSWQRRPLSLHFLFNDKAQYQKRYWPNSYPNSQPLCMSFLKDRS
jgi:hypothetical protein